MLNRSFLKVLALPAGVLTISLASAQTVYAPNSYSKPVLPQVAAANPATGDLWNSASWGAAAGQPGSAPVLPAAYDPQAATRAPSAASYPQPTAPGQNPFAGQAMPTAPTATPARPAQVTSVPGAAPGVTNPFASLPAAPSVASPNPNAQPFSLDHKAAAEAAGQGADAPETADRIDDSALRYYASKRDLQRVGAEMRRLKALYPGWQPPEDLFAPRSTVDEQPLWDLFAAGDYATIRSKIAAYRGVNPDWQPTDDLMNKLDSAEARVSLQRAFDVGNWNQVLMVAQARPQLLVCGELQSLWNVGEALARIRDYARSFDLYKYILDNCANQDERLATVQKASLLLPDQGTASLVMMGRILPDGTSEFEDIGFNPLRAKLGSVASGDATTEPVADDQLKRFADFVSRTGRADDAVLMGWYYYAQEEWEASNAWFSLASRIAPGPKVVEGLILTLRKLDKVDDALKLARAAMKKSPEVTKQYIEIISSELTDEDSEFELSKAELKEFESIVKKNESALGAQAIGWHYIAHKDLQDARSWFRDSVEWEENEGAVIGLAVVAARWRHYKTLRSLHAKYGDKYEAVAEIRR